VHLQSKKFNPFYVPVFFHYVWQSDSMVFVTKVFLKDKYLIVFALE